MIDDQDGFGLNPVSGAALAPATLASSRSQDRDEQVGRSFARRRGISRGWLVRRGLLAADLLGLTSAFALAFALYGSQGRHDDVSAAGEIVVFVISLPIWVVVAKLHHLYDRDEERADHSTTDDIIGVLHLVTIGAWLIVGLSLLTNLADPNLEKLLTFWALAAVLVPIFRFVARELCRRHAAFIQNALIVGAGDVGQLVARKLIRHPEYGINVVGFIDRQPKARRQDLPERLQILGAPEELRARVRQLEVDRVIFAFSNDPAERTLRLVRSIADLNLQIDVVPNLFELVGPRVGLHTVEGLPLVGLPPAHPSRSSRWLKRGLDVVVAGIALAVTAPVFGYVAWRIRRDSPGPVFFRQRRLGFGMREFTALKFRTMRTDADDSRHRDYIRATMSPGAVAEGDGIFKLQRPDAVTPFGTRLRRTSLDELPQLINVLRGEMSLVGPRPCIDYEIEHFEAHHFDRFLVPQGMTGLWQVTARANATFREALDMDVAYVRGWSLGLDLRLLLRTPVQLLRQRRATA